MLHKRKIRYLLCGGLAVSIYGIQRTTADIDLLIDFEKENLQNFTNTMKLLSYVGSLPFSLEMLSTEKLRNQLIEEKNLIVYSFYNSRKNTFLIDVLVKTPFHFEEIWKRRQERKVGNTIINLISVDDLIIMKRSAGRQQDTKDVELLNKLFKNE
ncbi:MAG TPA: hypothetical protein PL009_03940 [Flavipsychrobacter sp.]|nr:hypothetical protein [Flavipsychrobacter sp.]